MIFQRNALGPLPAWSRYASVLTVIGYDQFGETKSESFRMPPPEGYFWLGKDAETEWRIVDALG